MICTFETLFGTVKKPRVVVSQCWTGEVLRYHGRSTPRPTLIRPLKKKYELVFVCPESLGGLPVPRPAAPLRRKSGRTITDISGQDVTAQFIAGAEKALAIALQKDCKKAFLCKGSPSCDACGFFGEMLIENGVEVFNY